MTFSGCTPRTLDCLKEIVRRSHRSQNIARLLNATALLTNSMPWILLDIRRCRECALWRNWPRTWFGKEIWQVRIFDSSSGRCIGAHDCFWYAWLLGPECFLSLGFLDGCESHIVCYYRLYQSKCILLPRTSLIFVASTISNWHVKTTSTKPRFRLRPLRCRSAALSVCYLRVPFVAHYESRILELPLFLNESCVPLNAKSSYKTIVLPSLIQRFHNPKVQLWRHHRPASTPHHSPSPGFIPLGKVFLKKHKSQYTMSWKHLLIGSISSLWNSTWLHIRHIILRKLENKIEKT